MRRWLSLLVLAPLVGCPSEPIELEGVYTYVQLEPDECTQPFSLTHDPAESPEGDLCDGCGVRFFVELGVTEDGDCAGASSPEVMWLAADFDQSLVYTSGDSASWTLFGAGRVEGGPEGGRFLVAGPQTTSEGRVFTETWNVGWTGLPPYVP